MSKNEGDKNFFYIFIYTFMGLKLSFAHPPKLGGESTEGVLTNNTRHSIYIPKALHKNSGSADSWFMTICNKWIVQSQPDKSFEISHN